MTIGTKEHEDIMAMFEKTLTKSSLPSRRIEREDKANWRQGNVYQDGHTNALFQLYSAGYAHGRTEYMN